MRPCKYLRLRDLRSGARDVLRRFRRGWGAEVRKDFIEGAASLMLCNLGDYISGFFLQIFTPIIQSAPVLIALLPAASDARGDVYSSYGSRLGTLLHLGLARRLIREELLALVTILISVNLWVGTLTVLVSMAFKAEAGIEPSTTVFTALASALMASLFMVPATTWLATTSFKKGIDPDNVVAPITTLFVDMVTVPTLIAGYEVARRLPMSVKVGLSVVAASVAIYLTLVVARRVKRGGAFGRAWRVIKQNLPVIIAATSMSMIAGAILLVNIESIIAGVGIMAVIPAFLEDGGAIACRFSAKLSTSLHLGRVTLDAIPKDRWVLTQVGLNLLHAMMIFGALGTFGYLMALWGGATASWGFKVFLTVLLAGMMLSILISVITYYMALVSFRLGIDPDNVLAPILTSIADVVGTSSLAFILTLLMH